MADNDQDKTELPTSQKRDETRSKGNVASSKEVATFAVFFGGIMLLYFFSAWFAEGMLKLFQQPAFPFDAELTVQDTVGLYKRVLKDFLILSAPAFAIPIFGLLAYLLQIGFNFSGEPLKPSFSKINPIEGAKKIFSWNALNELAKSVLKVAVLCYVVFAAIKKEWAALPHMIDMEVAASFGLIAALSFKVMIKTVWVLAVIAIVDFAYQKWQHEKSMKMTKEEVKEENRSTEGDPMVKARIRSVQREMARKRMMQDVPEADVVVTNPTHLAVAIKYDTDKAASPIVVAKGAGLVAMKIREIAKEHGVPIVEDKPLARSLFKSVEVGMEIPVTLYKAVAEILAYVYKLKNKTVGGR
ncbi:MAG: flagellar biosynthesis protein FlhB [Proteobacteria bacterium]|nr:flagellar biosynthesis protein FlhB [Pseudomonadota bacterium]